jgi:hypothetical protein
MPVITTEKYHIHGAQQFVESLTEGLRTYGANTATVNANSTVLTISSNVFSTMRVGDILIINNESRLITAIASNGTSVTVNATFSTAISDQLFKTREQLAQYDTYYLFIGRSTPWAESDAAPEIPVDTEQASYDYLRDALALRRLSDTDVAYVVPRYTWTTGSIYQMYDHRSTSGDFANTELGYPYVVTSTNDVFKCIFNGRTSSDDETIGISIQEPTISGVASPSDLVTSQADNNKFYTWKYLYSISQEADQKFKTAEYMPVFCSSDTLDPGTGDVQDDNSAAYTVFNAARNSGNGAIYQIVVESGGHDYNPNNPPSVTIDGDGTGAIASVRLTGNVVTGIHMEAYGQNYSFATVSITTHSSGSGAAATAIISPRAAFSNTSGTYYKSNHGINPRHELHAHQVMLYAELTGAEGGLITTANEYRRIGIVKNPLLINGEIASANTYDLSTTLIISTADTFAKDEVVYQPDTGAYGVVVEQSGGTLKLVHVSRIPFSTTVEDTTIIGIGNGNTEAVLLASDNHVPSALPEMFTNIVEASGATATVTAVTPPYILPQTGEILYVNHVVPVIRANSQSEAIRTILTF